MASTWAGHVTYIRRREEVWCGNLGERDHLEDLGTNGWITLRWIFIKWDGVMDWIGLALDRDRRLALVNLVMNPWIP
jgi:hypothetical protein